ncbi:hypothetical protein N7448_007849 [Penicillium atrosanguineum]|uniref:Uncharacterized protein n=1 Tax=Penicillium atrosanguineum TaxID=1132637 RepID=A0A9W9GQD1_9EURO|nr:uncharacterized protein N7443_001130 [Penicillium atrosanguineum]KAJ5127070.1 hypothetical protein N7448_007849 [Penicillium atrosanguineum]KAJ5314246.1 hypothetical protein N7443_001130 [Penicillium atrosanguineum]KAJ5331412.1 hypothetical protein N7476_001195 [Penicillium atrosanguineum]
MTEGSSYRRLLPERQHNHLQWCLIPSRQIHNGNPPMTSHIKDIASTVNGGGIGAPSNSADKQVFHTDAGDFTPYYV